MFIIDFPLIIKATYYVFIITLSIFIYIIEDFLHLILC